MSETQQPIPDDDTEGRMLLRFRSRADGERDEVGQGGASRGIRHP